jgi:orotate phosphoribosyltransferase
VKPAAAHLDFVTDFARRSFVVGDFPARRGVRNTWLLDCRQGLGSGELVGAIAHEMIRAADNRGISQFVGAGFGAYLLVGAILGVQHSCRAALIRQNPKRYGRMRKLEGSITTREPVCLVDDILNSGTSAGQAVNLLRQEGFEQIYHLSVFRFMWGAGPTLLAKYDVDCEWLATVAKVEGNREVSPVCDKLTWSARLRKKLSLWQTTSRFLNSQPFNRDSKVV